MIKIKKVIIKGNKGVDLSEIKYRKHNFFIGISLSNKIFTPENIKSLIIFCLKNTKEKVLVLIPGRMHAINYRYFEEMTYADALRKAFEDEGAYIKIVENILGELDQKEQNKVVIANYDEICTQKYIFQKEILLRDFVKKEKFYEDIIEIVSEVITSRNRKPNKDKAESLALYVINELPLFIDGVQKNGSDTIYTVVPYPGFSKIDNLAMDIIDGEKFPELTKKLKITDKTGILDVNFEDFVHN